MITFFKHLMKTRKQLKARRDRQETKIEKQVRAACVERDGYCRFSCPDRVLGPCAGPSEWAHLGEWKRCFTRGLPPEERHHTKGSFMACRRHHRLYDAGELQIGYGDDGANGTFFVTRRAPKGAVA